MEESASWASSPGRRRNMRAIRRSNTGPEIRVRSILHARGMRYRVDAAPLSSLRNRADIVFTRARIAIFIDGCYWHGCPEHYKVPRVNTEYWAPKISGNRARDARVNAALHAAGWQVLRYWEHESPEDVAADVIRAVRSPSSPSPDDRAPRTQRAGGARPVL